MTNKTSAKRSRRNISDDEELGSDRPLILVPPREDDFNEKTWWMVDLSPVEEASLQGASALVKRCMRTYSWDEAKARKVLAAYRQFIVLKKNHQDWNAKILSPCYLVDQMWHCHILDVVNYCHDMMLLCGHVVGHNPDGALDAAAKNRRDDTTRASLEEHFGSYDEEVWRSSPGAANGNVKNVANQSEGAANDEESGAASPGVITIHMKSGEGEEAKTLLIVQRTIRMETVFNTFAASKKVTPSSLTFSLNGESIDENKTLEELDLKDDDVIDCLPTTIKLRLKFYNDSEFTVKVKRTDKMEEVFNNIVKTKKGYPASIYEVNGNFIQRDSTPESMRLNDNDLIRCRFAPLNNGSITIRLKEDSGEETLYVLKRTSRMNVVFNAHADRKGICLQNFLFMLDGERIGDDETPADLELEDGDMIDCFLNRAGC
eukprot:CAMPEP_0113397008 /NCGR_PEP_ID=MMETSP0013_2-20120614/14127_1 /TAXON_ID=2843 ORGANISM="Skeletonema costatum, Strain 1716" /NCGR_SAMPLE_ID=MMETSP0013_2 /ASSEMBLY_ACC=CAM_ASM_000158 /LENGTH=430 /DNA_ID=CAMNT_0000281515 /DNA_START=43 /DNA_END=1335 /DNA_ORIENTATION=- /assembly_acc=CAM_ASM_000158